MIAGGAVGLCAIIGLVVYLMMGSSDKKDSAKNDSSSTTPSASTPGGTPPNAGGPPAPGGGNGGGPAAGGGGGAPVIPPGWQVVQADGFSFAMPAQPKIGNVPVEGAAGVKSYEHEASDMKGALGVLVIDLPPESRQIDGRLILNAIVPVHGW